MNKMIHRIAAPSEAFVWRRLTSNLPIACWSTTNRHRYLQSCSQDILGDIRTATETHGGYQELLSRVRNIAHGPIQGAVAHSWFPRFLSKS
jgi:hypothetical protein